MTPKSIVDVHSHCLTADYIAAMDAAGVHDVEGFPRPSWSEGEHLALMDRHGIQSSILSVSTPGIDFATGQKRAALARRINEDMAERRMRSKGRFGAFALLPLPDVDAALAESAYALDVLKLDGLGVLSSYAGTYIGDAALDDILAEADRRGTVIFVHPTAPPHWRDVSVGFPAAALEYPFEVTRWLANTIASGALRGRTNLKFIATHGGGTMPFLANRLATLAAMQSRLDPKLLEAEFFDTLRRIYVDSTAVTQTVPLAAYKATVPPERRLFGSDHPFMPESSIPPALHALSDEAQLAPEERDQLERSNARSLFPELAKLWA